VTIVTTTADSLFSLTGAWQRLAARPAVQSRRRTKIVCTLGPASAGDGVEQLARAGMDAARLNFSHGAKEVHLASLRAVRRAEQAVARPLAVIADLCGPKIRVNGLREPRRVEAEEPVTLGRGGGRDAIGVTFPDLHEVVEPGRHILVDDGRIRLRVVDVDGELVRCRVEVGGLILPNKGVNLPGAALPIPALTPKDEADLDFALGHDVDYVALSFVQSAEDVLGLRERIRAAGSKAKIIAKIETAEAIRNLDAIIAATDAVMVARGDLGVEHGVSEVPLLQKLMIAKARASNRMVITATQMLESMIESAEPTRAEASDVANAIIDGTSAVMLSGETAVGKHPVAAVEMMDRIARVVEPTLGYDVSDRGRGGETAAVLTHAACYIAEDMDAAVIAVPTESGATARQVATSRARRPVVAASARAYVRRQLALEWGVVPVEIEPVETIEEMSDQILERIRELHLAAPGDVVVMTGRAPLAAPAKASHVLVLRMTGG
jgi:pyruvate kinase